MADGPQTYVEDPDNPIWRRSEWQVRARATGAMVGTLKMAMQPGARVYTAYRLLDPKLLSAPIEPMTPLPIQRVDATIDWLKGVVWVQHAGDLHRCPGFEWL